HAKPRSTDGLGASSAGTIEEQTIIVCALGTRLRIISGPSWDRTSDQSGRVDNQHATNYPSPNRACTFQRTRLSRDAVHLPRTLYLVVHRWYKLSAFPCVPSPCTGHYPDRLSTMD